LEEIRKKISQIDIQLVKLLGEHLELTVKRLKNEKD
jgi:chorismate mutase